mmetsp:Transcript_110204/g.190898  ORF Transcript_110204/g.190898 Transcript_110204/m.190898 type:complete len:86 (-) Transcript_110204:1812-2069(-)
MGFVALMVHTTPATNHIVASTNGWHQALLVSHAWIGNTADNQCPQATSHAQALPSADGVKPMKTPCLATQIRVTVCGFAQALFHI